MSAVRGTTPGPEDGTPPAFRRAVESLRAAAVRPEVAVRPIRAPGRLAPYTFAMSGTVSGPADDPEAPDAADGRLVLLYDPDGHEAWQGEFRVVTLAQAELEQEIAADPLLPEVGWSWLTEALAAHRADYREPSGTVSRSSSHYFGGLAERAPSTRIEIRASWTAAGRPPDPAAHLSAWCDLLCTAAGLPPAQDGVVAMPRPARRRD